jgi:hypothetical protein
MLVLVVDHHVEDRLVVVVEYTHVGGYLHGVN